jgi:hypothetical protein
MTDINIPDNCHIISNTQHRYLCHESCVLVNGDFSNEKYVWIQANIDKNVINQLNYICDTYDKIEKFTYFVGGVFKNFNIFLLKHGITIYDDKFREISFKSFEGVLQFLRENIPECVKDNS